MSRGTEHVITQSK